MNINAINHAGISPAVHGPKDKTIEENIAVTKSVVTNSQETAEEAVTGDSKTTETRGVIRNLINGHFKGVADIRLRINFHDEIMEMNQEAKVDTAIGNASSISDAVAVQTESITGNELPSIESKEAVFAAVEDFKISMKENLSALEESRDIAAFETAISESFDSFKTTLSALFNPAPIEEDEAVEGTGLETITPEPATVLPEGETPVIEPFDHEAFLSELTSVFESALAEFRMSIDDTSVLPPISKPSGNGMAYEKFMAIYNEMNNQIENIETGSTEDQFINSANIE